MVKPASWVVDMRHYIDEDTGDLPEVIPDRVLSLAIFFGAIVAWVTDPRLGSHVVESCRKPAPTADHSTNDCESLTRSHDEYHDDSMVRSDEAK
jgi:hypothetical protein